MLTGKPGLFGIDDISDTIQRCHVQNLVISVVMRGCKTPKSLGPKGSKGVLKKRRFQIKMKVLFFIVCSSFKRLFTNK
jgi:hypothetical protein